MPGNPPPVVDERDGLLSFLRQARYVLSLTAYGLTDDQARSAAGVSPLSVGGLIKHVAQVERNWAAIVRQDAPVDGEIDYVDGFTMRSDQTLAELLEDQAAAAAETEALIATIDDLDSPVPVPRDRPWFPKDVEAWSVRWVLLHLIQETSRHAGHADMVREAVDGGTAYPLMAAAEGWPASPWMQPWEPSAEQKSPASG